jgi:3',5'-cyclic-nucleotide phosphodiesterase
MTYRLPGILLLALGAATPSARADPPPSAFTAIVLGTSGGIDESDLTAILLSANGTHDFIALDAGTLYSSIGRAVQMGSLGNIDGAPPSPGLVIKSWIQAYLISHPHMDHVAGLTIVSPEDSPKPIFGLGTTLDALRDNLFNGALWANFTDEGPGALKRYHLARLKPGEAAPIAGTSLTVEAWPLSHGSMTSTAFLVRSEDADVLYLGDTGPDDIEKQGRLKALWTRIAPLIKVGRLRAIFLECSFPDPRADNALLGHLTPKWIAREMDALAALVDPKSPADALGSVTLVIMHIKPTLDASATPRRLIETQLRPLEARLKKLIIPNSGQRIELK